MRSLFCVRTAGGLADHSSVCRAGMESKALRMLHTCSPRAIFPAYWLPLVEGPGVELETENLRLPPELFYHLTFHLGSICVSLSHSLCPHTGKPRVQEFRFLASLYKEAEDFSTFELGSE